MSTAKWGSFSNDTTSIAQTGTLDVKATGTTTLVADIDNTSDRDLYASFWVELGSITPAVGGSVTLSLRRKRGSSYAEQPCEQVTAGVTGTGARQVLLEFLMRLPGPGVYGLYWTNNLGVSSAGSSNALYRADFNEEIA